MEKSWEILEGACYNCKKCRLSEMRTNVVIGKGNRNADIMFIGEGPGQQEDLTGIPFVGPAGQLLDKMLAAVNLSPPELSGSLPSGAASSAPASSGYSYCQASYRLGILHVLPWKWSSLFFFNHNICMDLLQCLVYGDL